MLQQRLKENEALALEFTATELFEAASVAKAQEWADMDATGRSKYDKLAQGESAQHPHSSHQPLTTS